MTSERSDLNSSVPSIKVDFQFCCIVFLLPEGGAIEFVMFLQGALHLLQVLGGPSWPPFDTPTVNF